MTTVRLAAVLAVAVARAAPAPANDGQDQTTIAICTAPDLGESIPQIVEQLGQGDPRWNPFD